MNAFGFEEDSMEEENEWIGAGKDDDDGIVD